MYFGSLRVCQKTWLTVRGDGGSSGTLGSFDAGINRTSQPQKGVPVFQWGTGKDDNVVTWPSERDARKPRVSASQIRYPQWKSSMLWGHFTPQEVSSLRGKRSVGV